MYWEFSMPLPYLTTPLVVSLTLRVRGAVARGEVGTLSGNLRNEFTP
jgi:hypothetical protein